eukprot:TRINITY_DN3162_c0_g1_i10.p1 TRINITY_DN3162_c0_g1~~TRINITY_DN3162_c0_g1_i10.p1  ORF type:complete len:430 (-),score=37.00 TRINITY_DN3162_c0_g1_i10:2664-3953(-)
MRNTSRLPHHNKLGTLKRTGLGLDLAVFGLRTLCRKTQYGSTVQKSGGFVLCATALREQQQIGTHIMDSTNHSNGMTEQSMEEDSKTVCLGWRRDLENNYILTKILGSGSFGKVYLGYDVRTNEEVAVKVLPKFRDQVPSFVSQFKVRNETQNFLAAQGCPSVARLFGCFEDDNYAYLVMELCKGGDLKGLLDVHGAFSERESAIVLAQVFLALEACHKRKVCFGDVKPANFLLKHKRDHSLDKEEQTQDALSIRTVDFGCSQRIIASEHLTKMTGTPLYMAPEMFMRDYAFEVDVWAAGVLLYQLLSDLPPFYKSWDELRASDQGTLMLDIMSNPVLFSGERWKTISAEAKDLVRSCLHKLPQKRLTATQALQHPFIQMHCDVNSFQSLHVNKVCVLNKDGDIQCSPSWQIEDDQDFFWQQENGGPAS